MSGKYYWLKLKRDFFKRHDVQIVEDMPNGKDYVLFYLKMLCESVDHEGRLRFSEMIPYNEQMLATVTHTNIDIVRSAVQIFTQLGMMEIMDDGTYFMTEVQKMIGSASNSEAALRQKRYRDRLKEKEQLLLENNETLYEDNTDITKCYESKSKNKRESKSKIFKPPTVEEVRKYCQERNNDIDPESFVDFYKSKDWMVGKNKMKDWQAAVRNWERSQKERKVVDKNPFNRIEQHSYDFKKLEQELIDD